MIRRSEWGHRRSIRRSRQRRAKMKPSAPDDPMPWSRGSVGLFDGRVEATKNVLAAGSSAPDDPTHCRCIALEQLCQRISTAMWRGRGTWWTDALEILASVHPTLPFSAAFSQRLVWCLGLFIPPPLTHLSLLDCVEVQESARHLEDHIQSIQVLNCSLLTQNVHLAPNTQQAEQAGFTRAKNHKTCQSIFPEN
jgi:hypothetical protein